ncbi:nose resistant to fluoxetine protein 6 [Onthophagus taurus]|uniref:nose resistant to fluoxetine protein 6 n=1 Tax=Onthophagus taurus TaxID=166361 RepID=UPI000C206430|nr:nose resistant to fluoxetine protein 6 [Onthophagus taurus]
MYYFLFVLVFFNAIFAAKSIENRESDGETVTKISRVLDIFDYNYLGIKFNEFQNVLSKNCSRDVETYIRGLKNNEEWALKMEDASGRYTTGWFWGNRFWLGSQNLCENIAPKNIKHKIEAEQNLTRTVRDISEKPSPSQSIGYETGILTYSSIPPYDVSFFVLKLELNSSLADDVRIVQMGLCLPLSCTNEEVKILAESTAKSSETSVEIKTVKSVHDEFDIYGDLTFKILFFVSIGVTIFLILGTIYDYVLVFQEKKDQKSIKTFTPNKLSVIKLQNENGGKDFDMEQNNNALEAKTEIVMEPKPHPKDCLTITVIKQIILSFSLRRNINTICDRSVGTDTISTIHGLKAISMVWVILGHTCIIGFKYSDNMEYRKVVQKEFFFQTITNGAFSVDTFFFTSGLLVSFLYFRTNAKGKLDALGRKGFVSGCMHFLGLVAYRFARLTAPYMFSLGLVEVSMKWFQQNSVFEPPTMDHVNCPKYWWRNMLFINTLFPDSEMCMLWSWYLSDDTQFYVLGAIFLIVAASYFKTAVISMVVFLLSSWITTAYISYDNEHSPSTNDPLALFDKIYDKPWTRLGPYLIGMCSGWLLFKTNCRIRISLLGNLVGWLASAACLLSLVYGLYEVDLSPLAGAAYSSLSHSAWALGLAWIIVACATGNGGFINSILSATILYPVSRITYCAYLLHPLVMRVMVMHMDSPLHLGKPLMIAVFIGQVVMSYVFGFVISLMFEAPVVSMLKIIQTLPISKPKRINP